MSKWGAWLGVAALLGVVAADAQTTLEDAREQGRTLAEAKRGDPALVPTEDARAAAVPGYGGTELPERDLLDDPDRLVREGAASAQASESYRTIVDPDHRRATFDAAEMKAITARARAVEATPSDYLAGEEIDATAASCVALPPGSGSTGFYEATCNSGTKVTDTAPLCRVPLVVDVSTRTQWRYQCVDDSGSGGEDGCAPFAPLLHRGTCRVTGTKRLPGRCLQGTPDHCTEPGPPRIERTLTCSEPVPGQSGDPITEPVVVAERRDETACAAAAPAESCELAAETCVDAEPQTREINGLPVTRACWAWQRRYSCRAVSSANDCSALEARTDCRFLRTECLDEEPGESCRVSERIFRCPVPGTAPSPERQYICGGDVYCLNGDCEPIVRAPSTEFRDALVALHALDQAGGEFDPATMAVFSGERTTCHQPVFGLVNCCAGRVSGLLTAAAGGAALAGGPAAIAALATPFLTLFLCSQEEMRLDIKDRMGFCHKVGTYCSASVLGICTSKKSAYCCFESKLSRILQEQGRPQIGKPWGSPKSESCRGFTVEEFARLDLSRMDFSEVYAEFLEAAKLPDEVQALTDIQAKIETYYDLHRPTG